jgi:hypothetical protein
VDILPSLLLAPWAIDSFDCVSSPNTVLSRLKGLDLSESSPVRKLDLFNGPGLSPRLMFLGNPIVREDRKLRVRDSSKPEERGNGKHSA